MPTKRGGGGGFFGWLDWWVVGGATRKAIKKYLNCQLARVLWTRF